MSIASRIEQIEQHLTDDYSVLELAGADLTNVDKNIENLKQSWEERLLYFLANGTDVVWNNWLPKVTGSGETITLNNTIEAKMNIVYKGNTYQYSTSGKNKSHFNRISLNGITFEGNDIDILNPTNYVYASEQWNLRNNSALSGKTYTIYSLANGTTGNRAVTLEIGTTSNVYAYQHQLSANTTYNNNLKVQAVTLGANDVFSKIDIYVAGSTTANINIKVMVVEGSYTEQTIGDYEPYTNGASPNPDYPQDIQVVSGDNTIIVSNSDNTQSQSYHVSLGNIELCKIGTYQDKIYKDNGKWYLHKEINKIVYTGSESGSWTPSTSGGLTRFAGPNISNAIQTASRYEIKSNYFHYLSSGGEVGAGFIYSGQFFAYPNQTITTEQNFRNWLSTHNTTVYYVLATPTYEEITDTTLISQLEAIKKSYNTQTNISQTNADKPFILDVTALGN